MISELDILYTFTTSSKYAFKNSAARLPGFMFFLASSNENHSNESISLFGESSLSFSTKTVKLHISCKESVMRSFS